MPISKCYVDARYQRHFRKGTLDAIVKEFNFDALGAIWLSKHSDDHYTIIDGQHRVMAMREVFGESAEVPAVVYHDLSAQEEADLFVRAQSRLQMTPGEVFRAQLFAGDEETIEIDQIVKRHEFFVYPYEGAAQKNGSIMAVKTLYDIHRMKPGLLNETLALLKLIWDGEPRSLQHDFLRGMAAFLFRYGGIYNARRLQSALRSVPTIAVARKAEIFRLDGTTSKIGVAWGRAFLSFYNGGLGDKNRLPEWGDKRRVKVVHVENEEV